MQIAEGVRLVTFGILSILMLGAALGVVLLPNIVYSAFLLGGVFISMSGIYILLNADFVSAAQILIYVGAVNVLILFAIMLVNKREDFKPLKNGWVRQGASALVCGGLFTLLSAVAVSTPWKISTSNIPLADSTVRLAKHFFTDFLLPFELASVLLLMAMVGAIILARREFMPEDGFGATSTENSLTLPERPRELAGVDK